MIWLQEFLQPLFFDHIMLSLSIDVGNSRTKIGLFKGKSLLKSYIFQEKDKIDLADFHSMEVDNAIVSTVLSIEETEKKLSFFKRKPIYLSQQSKLPFLNEYSSPETLGKDRIAAVAGAMVKFKKTNLLVVDAGTCITFDFINSEAEYLGGSISPGVNMRLKAMHQFTSKLPLAQWTANLDVEVVGNNTQNAILSGAVNGAVAEIDGIIDSYKKLYKGLKVVLTGGDSPYFEKKLKNTIFADSNLVLKGLNEILFFNIENH